MTFRQKYQSGLDWSGKVMVMEIYHLTMKDKVKKWTVAKTAKYFRVSIGLVSENLKLARAIHDDSSIMKWDNRQDALEEIK